MDGPLTEYTVIEYGELAGMENLWDIFSCAPEKAPKPPPPPTPSKDGEEKGVEKQKHDDTEEHEESEENEKILHNEDDVLECVTNVLLGLHQKVCNTISWNVNSVRSRFVEACVARIKAARDQDRPQTVARFLHLLQTFLTESKCADLAQEGKEELILDELEVREMKSKSTSATPPSWQKITGAPKIKKGKEGEVAFLKEMMNFSTDTPAIIALSKNYYNMDATLNWLMNKNNLKQVLAQAGKYDIEAEISQKGNPEKQRLERADVVSFLDKEMMEHFAQFAGVDITHWWQNQS